MRKDGKKMEERYLCKFTHQGQVKKTLVANAAARQAAWKNDSEL